MAVSVDHTAVAATIRVDIAAIFVSLELSRSKWLVTSLSPGAGEKTVEALGNRWRRVGTVGSLIRAATESDGQDGTTLSDCRHPGSRPGWYCHVEVQSVLAPWLLGGYSLPFAPNRVWQTTDNTDSQKISRPNRYAVEPCGFWQAAD